MAQLLLDEAVSRFKENEDRIDIFVNQTGSYVTNETIPRQVETLPSLSQRIKDRYLSLLYRGAWATSTQYALNDIVKQDGVFYLCADPHASSVFANDFSSNKWIVYGSSLVINVKSYGAKGDGITDDAGRLEQAFAAADAVGGTVILPSGIYLTSRSLSVSNRIDVIGERGAILKRIAPVHILNISGEYSRIVSLDFDGNKTAFPYPAYSRSAVIFATGFGNTISDCFIYQGNSHGIALDGQTTNCKFNIITTNNIADCDEVGIAQNKTADNIINANVVRNSGFEGITIDNACYKNVVNANRLDGNCRLGGVGSIGMDGAELNSITGNLITATGSGLSGIKMQNNLAGCAYNTITGNVIIDGGVYGIHLYNNSGRVCTFNAVSNNVIRGFSTASVKTDIGCDSNVITGNPSDKPVLDNGFRNTKQTGVAAFRARNNTPRTNVTGDGTLYSVLFDTEDFDYGNCFNTATGIFTAPTNGIYQLNATVRLEGGSSQTYAFLQIVTTNETLQQSVDNTTGTPVFTPSVSGLVYMDAGNTAVVRVQSGGGASGKIMDIAASPSFHQFSGFLVA